jgi:hypothetical protein
MIPRQERTFVGILVATVVLVVLVAWWVPTPVDWSDSFAANDPRPYASEVVRMALPDLFREDAVRTVADPPFLQLQDTTTSGGAYLFMTARFAPDKNETERLLNYAARGNTVFVAAHSFGGAWADTLGLATQPRPPVLPSVGGRDTVRLQLAQAPKGQEGGVPVRAETAAYVFDSLGTASATVLGTVATADSTAPSFVRRSHGEGTLLLSSTPRAFTNAHTLDKRTASYVWAALSHIPHSAAPVWWDAHYKPGRSQAQTPLRFVLSTPALQHAYVVLLVGGVLFFVVKARRRQRVIPVIDPPSNATVDFVTTLGRLAHRRGNAETVAQRRVTYLLASIRERLDVTAEPLHQEWIQQVAARSGAPPDDVTTLAQVIGSIRNAEAVSEAQLEELDRCIQIFREARSR